MKSRSSLLSMLALYVFVWFIAVSDSAESAAEGDKSGFISIDCGASTDYVDKATGIWYQTDEGFIENESGNPHGVAPNVNFHSLAPTINRQLMTLRSFPEGERNCYTLKPKQQEGQKHKYLIRAIFAYGNYDFKNQPPVFQLYLGINYWTTVQANSDNYSPIYPYEVIMELDDSSTENMVQVCLVNTGKGTPFINSLELRPLNYSLYPSPLPLIIDDMSSYRTDLGSGLPITWTRYKDDVYDRLWWNDADAYWDVLQTSLEEAKANNSVYELPLEVLRTALQPRNHTNLLTVNWRIYDVSSQYYLFLHFFEIEKLPPGRKRIINVTFDDENSSSHQLTLEYLKPITLSSNKITNSNYINFTVKATNDSDAPPILNAAEFYKFLPQPNSPTAAQDVKAIKQIRHVYGVSKIGWQGDPCVPSDFAWDRLNCSYGNNNIRIISLNLSSSKLIGVVDPSLANLERLESLDLSNNELTGQLPEFLATLPNLKFINVTGNKLTGTIPKALREKANLELSLEKNPGLCPSSSCKEVKEHNKFVIPLVASLSTLAIVTVPIVSLIWRFKKKSVLRTKKDVVKPKNQTFSYSKVLHITKNLKTIIGEGGFSKVYLGTLEDDTQVAVKLISLSSRQGYKEFQSEAQLLTVIHHRNLVSLVGFCDDNDVKALIYEYMELGDLNGLLSEKNQNVLKWSERLQVAVDAAKGLEYLHNGCKTPIIHRDLKPSNILLNKFKVAKIADFGLSKAFTNEIDSHLSTQLAGTPGYIDPEFQRSGKLDKKSDMYSFGMILLQLITGHPPIRRQLESICFIIDWIQPNIECRDIQSIVDQRLKGEFQVSSAWKAVETAMSCTEPYSSQRPEISYVLNELKECLATEIGYSNSNEIPSNPINYHSGQLDSISTLSAR